MMIKIDFLGRVADAFGEAFGAESVAPGVEGLLEGFGDLGMFVDEVVFFLLIVGEVEEEGLASAVVEEFPLAFAGGGSGTNPPPAKAIGNSIFPTNT